MQILNIDWTNAPIGSHTLPEYRCQVCNFMNMLWDNINRSERCRCMTVEVVTDNLRFEIKRLASELNVSSAIYASKVEELITAIRVIVRELTASNVNSKYTFGEQKNLKKLANDSWKELLDTLTKTFSLENYTINVRCLSKL